MIRAGTLGLPLTIAIIGGQPDRFTRLVELYRKAVAAAGHDADVARLAINTHAFVGETSQLADAVFGRPCLTMMNRIGRERGRPPSGLPEHQALRSPLGGSPSGRSSRSPRSCSTSTSSSAMTATSDR